LWNVEYGPVEFADAVANALTGMTTLGFVAGVIRHRSNPSDVNRGHLVNVLRHDRRTKVTIAYLLAAIS